MTFQTPSDRQDAHQLGPRLTIDLALFVSRKLENQLKRQGRGKGFYRMIGLRPPSGS